MNLWILSIGAYVRLIEDFESNLYESDMVPIALAQKYTAISLQPGGKVLDILAQSVIQQQLLDSHSYEYHTNFLDLQQQ